jgi:membrane protease subunit HflC
MEAERSRVAKELRAKGAEEAEKIRSNADRQRRILVARAERDAQILRGEGDAIATRTYADAFGRDSEFYELYRSLNAYEKTFGSKDDLLVLEPNSQFFRFFNDASPQSLSRPASGTASGSGTSSEPSQTTTEAVETQSGSMQN